MSVENRAIAALQNQVEWTARQRWFGDKARAITSMTPELVDVVDTGHLKVALAVVRFSFQWGDDSLYFIPIVESPAWTDGIAGRHPGDAVLDGRFLEWLVDGFGELRTVAGDATWSWRTIGDWVPAVDGLDFASARPISGEQSNSSIIFDRRFIGKVFRRVQPGLNPDLEIGEFLSSNDRFRNAPQLYGLIEVTSDRGTIALAAMQEFVPNIGDGWTWFLRELRSITSGTLEGLVEAVRLLGRRTGELHVALASDPVNDAFAPVPFTAQDAQALIGRVIAEIEDSVEGLARHISPTEVQQIHSSMGQLMGGAHSAIGTYTIRVHGDYHLGQTLRTVDGDFVLIDFEGEPSRTMDQRRMKLPALKDVAGMVRSLDYAAATILRDESDPERSALVRLWLAEAREGFVQSYRETAGTAQVPIVPEDDAVFTGLLDLMIAEKAMYEVRYELNNRPDWLDIPLNALRQLAGIEQVTGET
jgi:maltokinase